MSEAGCQVSGRPQSLGDQLQLRWRVAPAVFVCVCVSVECQQVPKSHKCSVTPIRSGPGPPKSGMLQGVLRLAKRCRPCRPRDASGGLLPFDSDGSSNRPPNYFSTRVWSLNTLNQNSLWQTTRPEGRRWLRRPGARAARLSVAAKSLPQVCRRQLGPWGISEAIKDVDGFRLTSVIHIPIRRVKGESILTLIGVMGASLMGNRARGSGRAPEVLGPAPRACRQLG